MARRLVAVLIISLSFAGGCSSYCARPGGGGMADITRRMPMDFPATYKGTLPGADGAGIDHSLNIWSDGVYFLRQTYRGEPEAVAHFDQIGYWEFSKDGKSLILRSKEETPILLAIEGKNVLRLLDHDSRPIESSLNYALERQPAIDWFEPRVRLHGMYTYLADAGQITECLTRLRLPVAAAGDNAALERSYSFARSAPGEPMLVSVEGRIINRPRADGAGKEQALVVDKFLSVWPGESCWPEVKVQARSCGR
ncbi:MAG TPA: copper resistance protein NlpE N-terminal domain-containing protein [bacterium]|nr:copper resistance protein NlpE N-terminal domain-containing protein [bacterium]